MLKSLHGLESSYEPSKRSTGWLKLKKDYWSNQDEPDSLDLIVVGAYKGSGKLKDYYTSFLMACYDDSNGRLQVIGKCGSGIKEDMMF